MFERKLTTPLPIPDPQVDDEKSVEEEDAESKLKYALSSIDTAVLEPIRQAKHTARGVQRSAIELRPSSRETPAVVPAAKK